MSKRKLASDAYAAGFEDGRKSVGQVRDDDAGDHCVLGFAGWYADRQRTLLDGIVDDADDEDDYPGKW